MTEPVNHNLPNALTLVRDPGRLASAEFDVLIVGGGVYGVWATLDAAQRGLKVALLEQNDFGSGASANSQRVVHGGLRYLQHADFKRMRESIRERSTLLRVAGHLIEPMPFLVPTYGLGMRGRPAMFTAMKVNDLVSCDRNKGLATSRRLPNGRLISRDETLALAPGIETDGLTGGAIFYDAQVNNSERLALSVIKSAVAAGAQVANHVRVTGLVQDGNRVTGVTAEDRLAGKTFTVSAKVTIGCAGPWTGRAGASLLPESHRSKSDYTMIRAVALVTRDVFDGMGLAVPSRKVHKDSKEVLSKGFRNLFVTSWCGRSLVGTFYTDYKDDPDALSVSADEVRSFIDEFNQTYPAAGLSYDDVLFTFMGLQPKAEGSPDETSESEPVASKRYRLIDHAKADGVAGLITTLGVKWTTARDVAEKAVSIAADQLGKPATACRTAATPIHGTPAGDPETALQEAIEQKPDWADEALITHLFGIYGTAYNAVLGLAEADPTLRERVAEDRSTILAQLVYAARHEMAQTLLDALLQRTDLGLHGRLSDSQLQRCAEALGGVLNWARERRDEEVRAVRRAYEVRGLIRAPG